jgi:hypothetical protein
VTDFLFRMVQRAAGWSTAAPAPLPPSQFHWPTPVDASVMQPTLLSANSDASRRIGTRWIATTPGPNSSEAAALKPDWPAMTPFDQPHADFFNIKPLSSTSAPTAHERAGPSVASNSSLEITLVGSHTPVGVEPLKPAQPAGSRGSGLVHREPMPQTNPRPTTVEYTHAPSSRAATWPAKTADFHAEAEPALPSLIEHALPQEPAPLRSDIPTRLVTPAQQAPPRSARGHSRPQEPQPAVEVKIGSVEIVFDQPPVQAAQPAPVRPAGFADFADLRRYAARPWSSRGR